MNYGTYENNSLESFAEILLRTEKLTETKSKGKDLLPTTEGMGTWIFTSVFTICSKYKRIYGWVSIWRTAKSDLKCFLVILYEL